MTYTLRPYQQQAIDETLAWMRENTGNPIMWLPTAAGKSLLVAELCRLSAEHKKRVLMVVPSKELAEQNIEKIQAFVSGSVGVLSASIRKDCPLAHLLLVATIGTVARMEPGNLGHVGLVIIDESHLVNPNNTGMYRKLITGIQRFNPQVRVIGLTATPFRGNGVWLYRGKDPLFDDIATRVEMTDLLDAGYLSPIQSAKTSTRLKADGVRIDSKTGDYAIGELAAAVGTDELVKSACDELIQIGQDRHKWMVFCVTIEHATNMLNELIRQGINAVLVTGKTPKAEREQSIALFRSGHYRAIVNVAALTTGFDVPEIDLIALLRNTRSPVLFTQIIGRGMRIAEGKIDCLWADFTDSTAVLGPVDLIAGAEPRKKQNRKPVLMACPECGEMIHPGYKLCPYCDAEIPKEYSDRHQAQVNEAPVMSGELPPVLIQSYPVSSVSYSKHRKRGQPDAVPSMRVDYMCGLRVFSEWICLEHSGYARRKAESWWPGSEPAPARIDDALQLKLPDPTEIIVNETGKYPRIVDRNFTQELQAHG